MTATMDCTDDVILRGALTLRQPRRGYRFNVDALLLAHFAWQGRPHAPRTLVDLGAGCGVIGLLLARRWPEARALLLEIQPEMALLAAHNARESGLDRRVSTVCADLRRLGPGAWPGGGAAELVLSNPPFFAPGAGRASPRPEVALARHGLACTPADLAAALAAWTSPTGTCAVVYPANQADELLACLARRCLHPTRMRWVRPLSDAPRHRVMIRARAGGPQPPPNLEPDLVVSSRPGRYTGEADAILEDRW